MNCFRLASSTFWPGAWILWTEPWPGSATGLPSSAPFSIRPSTVFPRASSFAAITYRFAVDGKEMLAAVVVLALLGSLLVSYVRARAEGLGGKCKVGLLTRAERVILLTVGLLFGGLPAIIVLLAVLTGVTVAQRVYYVARQFEPIPESDEAAPGPSSA